MKTIVTLALLAASPVAAQQFTLPQGCEAYLTIQTASCNVSHHFICDFDAEGEQRRASMDEEGLSYVGKINAEAEWVESFHLRAGHTEQLMSSADSMSMTDLLAGDVDTWDFTTTSDEIGDSRYVGFDQLTGETVVIDGVTLMRTEYALTSYDGEGAEKWNSAGREFVSTEWRMFIGGTSTFTTQGESFESDDTPVEFIFPGEDGFLSVNPKHGCGVEMSSFDAQPLIIPTAN